MADDPSFAKDIKPLFREKDRNSMLGRFDLWSFVDVRDNAPTILEVLRAGTMPCDGQWSPNDVNIFARWMAGETAE
jgi:hypothetical protein